MAYAKACNLPFILIVTICFLLSAIVKMLSSLWLSEWSDDLKNTTSQNEPNRIFRLVIYILYGVAECNYINLLINILL